MIRRGRAVKVAAMNTHIQFDIGSSTLGRVLVASNDKGVCAIFMADTNNALIAQLRERFPEAELLRDAHALAASLERVLTFIETPAADLDLSLDVHGTDFQQRVWHALRDIPRGATASYADVARRINAPKSFRAVAQACGANPIALAIPCHRVVRNDGALSGYRWGVARKRTLLEREARR
jgi:AraC family transcriptional regulator of adaptative response/methylated-DNA-[protein]-cysteine methyltransferase